MRKTIYLFIFFVTSILSSFGQKIIKTGDVILSNQYAANSLNNEVVGMQYVSDKGLYLYSWQPIAGKVLDKSGTRVNETTGSPYFSEKVFDAELKEISETGEFVSVHELDKSKQHVFQMDNGKNVPIKSFLRDIFDKYENFELVKILNNEVKWGDYKNAISMDNKAGYPEISAVILFPNNSNGTYEKMKLKRDKYAKENSEKFFRHVRGNADTEDKGEYTTQISKNTYQALVKFYDKEKAFAYLYTSYKLISFDEYGKIINVEDTPLKYASGPECYLPLYDANGKIDGSIVIFEKYNAGLGKIKNPNANNYYACISNGEGKVVSKFEFNYGEKGKALNTYKAFKVNDKVYLESKNDEKKEALEIIELTKDGKATTMLSVNKVVTWRVGGKSDNFSFNDYNNNNVFSSVFTTNDNFYLVEQRKIQRTANDDYLNGNVIITVYKKDFSAVKYYVIGHDRTLAPSQFEVLKADDSEVKLIMKDERNYFVTLADGKSEIKDFTPENCIIPSASILTKNYSKIPDTNQYYFIYKNVDPKMNPLINMGKIVLVEF